MQKSVVLLGSVAAIVCCGILFYSDREVPSPAASPSVPETQQTKAVVVIDIADAEEPFVVRLDENGHPAPASPFLFDLDQMFFNSHELLIRIL